MVNSVILYLTLAEMISRLVWCQPAVRTACRGTVSVNKRPQCSFKAPTASEEFLAPATDKACHSF